MIRTAKIIRHNIALSLSEFTSIFNIVKQPVNLFLYNYTAKTIFATKFGRISLMN